MMSARARCAALLALAPLLGACSGKPEEPGPDAARASAPRFYYDLGPATVDVSGYPERQRENYRIFLSVCGACHTAARPLNSPYAEAAVWKRFVRRMHVKMESRAALPSPEEEERILEFLVYDSQFRKTARRADFSARQEQLKEAWRRAAGGR